MIASFFLKKILIVARNNKKRKEIINIEHEFNSSSNIAEGSSAAAQRQNTDQPPAKRVKIKQSTTKTRTSWVWNYFEINKDDTGIVFAQCKAIEDDEMECGVKILHTGPTGNLIKHLARKHTLTKNNSSTPSVENKVMYPFYIIINIYFSLQKLKV